MSEKLSIDDLAEILHSFSEKQIGSKFMIETLSQVFEDQIRDKIKNNSKLDCQSAYKGIVAMDKIGLPKAGYFIEKLGGIIDKNLDYEQLQTLNTIFKKYAERQNNEKLAKEIKDKIEKL